MTSTTSKPTAEIPTPLLRAAITVSALLTARAIPHALFGGLALLLHSKQAYRETKDVDFLVSASKFEITNLLSYDRTTWILIPQSRDDYVAYFFKDRHSGEMVLVELFTDLPEKTFPRTTGYWSELSPWQLPLLTPAALFRGKVSACAGRRKVSDMFDMLFLSTNFPEEVRQSAKGCERGVAAAVKRWPQLKLVFERAGIRVGKSAGGMLFRYAAGGQESVDDVNMVARIPVGGVQRGLGCPW